MLSSREFMSSQMYENKLNKTKSHEIKCACVDGYDLNRRISNQPNHFVGLLFYQEHAFLTHTFPNKNLQEKTNTILMNEKSFLSALRFPILTGFNEADDSTRNHQQDADVTQTFISFLFIYFWGSLSLFFHANGTFRNSLRFISISYSSLQKCQLQNSKL